ncbi:PTI1-like tyrosine-protein kinase 2 [Chenopodium quinoa]|uniref:PTI1-like tyrosine-protein kinase 2 n=1 Tax=Chenopodium quinoa TaxID=63459 RepID=UPI000B77BEFE|nr:PTI1-like tyrosine-protein kinase 2 [Chenopodium quinoa]
MINNGLEITIKKLDTSSTHDSDSDFAAQFLIVSRLKHEHFRELIGYCLEQFNRILVYQYATMGSKHDVLHVLKNIDEGEKTNKEEGEGESHAKKKIDFQVKDVDLESDFEVSVAPSPTPKRGSKVSRPPPKLWRKRKAAVVAMRRLRGLPDLPESDLVVLSSDEEAEH